MQAPDLNGRRFAPEAPVTGGDVGMDTLFEYRQDGQMIWAEYQGGDVRRGFLVGVRDGAVLQFRYCQLAVDGSTSTGRCTSKVSVREDARVVLREDWAWESRAGGGTSVLVEVPSM
jgi:hypothetical protein